MASREKRISEPATGQGGSLREGGGMSHTGRKTVSKEPGAVHISDLPFDLII